MMSRVLDGVAPSAVEEMTTQFANIRENLRKAMAERQNGNDDEQRYG